MAAGFFEHDLTFRVVGDTLVMSSPLIVSEAQIGEAGATARTLRSINTALPVSARLPIWRARALRGG